MTWRYLQEEKKREREREHLPYYCVVKEKEKGTVSECM